VLLLVSVIITAGFIPNMLAKGSLDLIVSKPVGRVRLLLYKYVGGLLFILILTTFTVVGVWLAIGARTGIWTTNFLAIVPILTFYFAVLYAVSATAAVFTRNTLVAIVITGLAWAGLWAVGKVNDGIENRAEQQAKVKVDANSPEGVMEEIKNDRPLWGFIPKEVFPVVTALHVVTPRTYQLDDRLGRLIAEGVLTPNQLKMTGYTAPARTSWTEMLFVSLGGVAALLAVACWRFTSRDY
jgi:ABC-type transport system involved in multi-copper enzyme maturation permease subunit